MGSYRESRSEDRLDSRLESVVETYTDSDCEFGMSSTASNDSEKIES